MNTISRIYTFDDFQFDADRFALYHKGVMLKNGDKKTMQVLAVLLLNPNKLTVHDEIIERVWRDNPHGVTSGHIGQYISRLRKIFAEFAPDQNFVQTVKGRGYSFVGDVSTIEPPILPNLENELSESKFDFSEIGENSAEPQTVFRKNVIYDFIFPRYALVFIGLISIFSLAFAGWFWVAENDDKEIRRIVKESQMHETLILYKNPASFTEESMDKYWTADINANYDRQRIRESVKKLNDEGRRYGGETKCEQFEFQSVEINQDKNLAVVKTLEKWFIAVYFNDGTLQKNRYIGPYFVSYILRKADGKWLIEKSNTARVNRPTPRLSDIETLSQAKSGQQFFVTLKGQDFELETVRIEIIGEGCPEIKPCKLSNTTLREGAKLTETALENVSLNLASGDFQIVAHNGDSKASNSVSINVP